MPRRKRSAAPVPKAPPKKEEEKDSQPARDELEEAQRAHPDGYQSDK